ncbi:MAG: hypothetical protein L7F78_04580 [Syntrophales bacterium LBB04]|nr:hypothetical protein [Syntrophales bacterium LBB04]
MGTQSYAEFKQFNELWWKFLKESDQYKIFCDSLAGHADYKTAFLRKMFPIIDKGETNLSAAAVIFSEVLFLMTYERFGNVFHSSFDDWWATRRTSMSTAIVVEDLEETIEREACFFVGYCARVFKTQKH